MSARVLQRLSLEVDGDAPPKEFRIFGAGKNDSTKGPVFFSELSQKEVLKQYSDHGVDVMIDLEHLSLDKECKNFDPDARGWCELEVRNSELWAVNVRWTPDGEERLRAKKQKYISPAFFINEKREVDYFVNIALTAMPATYGLTPLVASRRKENMDEKLVAWLASYLGLESGATEGDVTSALASLDAEKIAALVVELFKASQPSESNDSEDNKDSETSSEDSEIAEEARKLTKRTKANEVKAGLKALSSAGPASSSLQKQLERMQKQIEQRDVRDLVAQNRDKITPALEAWALSQTLGALQSFLEHAPKSVSVEPIGQPEKTPKIQAVELTDEDKALIELSQLDPKKYLEHKRKLQKAVK